MANFCTNCGSKIEVGTNFCGNCGAKIGDSSPAPAQAPANTISPTIPASERKSNLLPLVFVAVIVLVVAIFAFNGNKLNGTYVATDWSGQSFTFNGNKITLTAFGMSAEGTYKIKGDELQIHYSLFGSEHDISYNFYRSGDAIYIEGTRFEKR